MFFVDVCCRYLVQWEGDHEPSWQPRSNLTKYGCSSLVKDIDQKYESGELQMVPLHGTDVAQVHLR
jgi:hypothetical protein